MSGGQINPRLVDIPPGAAGQPLGADHLSAHALLSQLAARVDPLDLVAQLTADLPIVDYPQVVLTLAVPAGRHWVAGNALVRLGTGVVNSHDVEVYIDVAPAAGATILGPHSTEVHLTGAYTRAAVPTAVNDDVHQHPAAPAIPGLSEAAVSVGPCRVELPGPAAVRLLAYRDLANGADAISAAYRSEAGTGAQRTGVTSLLVV